MNFSQIALELARDRQEELIADAARKRRSSDSRLSTHPSIRRSIGRRVIAVGERIAADPALELARSR
ncbi:MAG TPA: hypothetical protein VFN41_07940 [Candidatus Limnocylindrales bacterium]|nr:hypothetical protein [Candidatus Limnocylindrales bacterium]